MLTRRALLGAAFAPPAACDLFAVRATERTVWLFVRLRTPDGLEGWGEASDAFGFANTTKEQAQRMESELRSFAAGKRAAPQGLIEATAFSAVEQAQLDIAARRKGVPMNALLGRGVHASLPIYANINRATKPRTPAGFAASARRAVAEGFRAVKLAPFDGFPATTIEDGIAAVLAVRAAVGDAVEVLVDCHSFFTVEQSKQVAQRLEPARLGWYEEPVAPTRTEDTALIHRAIKQRMAGGEILFGVEGFSPLCNPRAVDVIMPDVKHCGGPIELVRIAKMARRAHIEVSPHNPSGPIATLATLHAASVLPNARIVELQWGEVEWRAELIQPAECIERGAAAVPSSPGLGARINEAIARRRAL